MLPGLFRVSRAPFALSLPILFRVHDSVLVGSRPLPFPRLLQVRNAPLEGENTIAFHASAAAHVALCDMAALARRAGEIALQAERSGLVTADDAGRVDSHSCPRAEPIQAYRLIAPRPSYSSTAPRLTPCSANTRSIPWRTSASIVLSVLTASISRSRQTD